VIERSKKKSFLQKQNIEITGSQNKKKTFGIQTVFCHLEVKLQECYLLMLQN